MAKGIKHASVGTILSQAEWEADASHALDSGTGFPGSPTEGDLFYRTDEHLWYIYDGSAWTIVNASPVKGASYVIFIDGSTIKAVNGTTGIVDHLGTDAATVIQAAIDAASGAVLLRAGTYNIPDYTILYARNGSMLVGEGANTIIKRTGTPSADNFLIYVVGTAETPLYNVTISDLTLEGNEQSSVHGIRTSYCERSLFTRLRIQNMGIEGGADEGIVMHIGSHRNIVSHNFFYRCGAAGVEICQGPADYNRVLGNTFVETPRYASEQAINLWAGGGEFDPVRHNIVANNLILNPGSRGITINKADYNLIANNKVINPVYAASFIDVSAAYYNQILGNTLVGGAASTTHGIEILPDGTALNLLIQGNTIQGFTTTQKFGIYNRAKGVLITANYFIDNYRSISEDAAATSQSFIQGNWFGNTLKNIGSISIVKNNFGYVTENNVLSNTFAIDSTGVKTVTIAHGCAYTPVTNDCAISVVENTAVDDWRYDLLKVVSVDATNVTVKINVCQSSATGSATAKIALRVGKP